MAWDPEKYREKREKVLGVRKRGLSFGMITVIVSCVILLGLGALSLPGAVSYLKTRHLDDAIFRLENNQTWPGHLVARVAGMEGVAAAALDTHDTRLVITYDRRRARPDTFVSLFKQEDLKAAMLNQVNHRQRMATMAHEKETEI